MDRSDPPNNKKIFLIGPPNCGKTTLFNWITGFKNKTLNYPGSTALVSAGKLLEKYNLPLQVIDTPGVYSLFPKSEDEEITVKSLFTACDPFVILVLDASKLEVQLPLFFQLKESGCSLAIALTMGDLLPQKHFHRALLEKSLGTSVTAIKGLTGEGVVELIEKIQKELDPNSKAAQQGKKWGPSQGNLSLKKDPRSIHQIKEWDQNQMDECLKKSKKLIQNSLFKSKKKDCTNKKKLFYSDRLDKLFLHPKKGLFLFAFIMFALFYSIFWLSAPFMSAVDNLFTFFIDKTSQSLSSYPYLSAFLSKGLIASLGAVLVFAPQIFILFIGISLLEDTGYLARAVALMDGPFSKIGLSGRAFLPFLSGHACAIPATMAVRSLSSKREKWMSFFAIPFMTCSARLPVYALLLSFLFYGQSAWKPGLALSLIYVISFFLGVLAVLILNLFLKKEEKELFLLDLPVYRRPVFKKVLRYAARQSQNYLFKAGPAIFIAAFAIWLLSHLPLQPDLPLEEQIKQSYAGQIGQMIEPLFQNMGVDWRVGLALIAAFTAREVFVSVLVLVFSLTEASGTTESLLSAMKMASHSDGAPIFTTASVLALVVFFMFSLQCLSTTAIVYKESGSFKLALSQLITLNILAYVMATAVYQGLSFFL